MYNILHAISTRKKRGKLLALIFAMAFLGFADFIPQAHAQANLVTFQNDRLKVNGSDYVTRGWYGIRFYPQGTQPGWNQNGDVFGYATMMNNHQQVVLVYWNMLIDTYAKVVTPPLNVAYNTVTVHDYIKCVHKYLDHVDLNYMKAFIQIPYKDLMDNITDTTWINPLLRDPIIKNHRAFLGWYLADEPEQYRNATKPLHNQLTYLYFKERYDYIGTQDPNHPTLVVTAQPGWDSNSTDGYWHLFGKTKKITKKGGAAYNGKIYDILAIDNYPLKKNDYVPYSQNLYWTKYILDNARKLFLHELGSEVNEAGIFFIGQGFADIFLDGSRIYFDTIPSSSRVPTIQELLYSWMTAYQYAQIGHSTADKNRSPINGIMSWDYGFANQQCRDTVHQLSKFMKDFDLDIALRQSTWNGNITLTTTPTITIANINPIVREHGEYIFVVIINHSAVEQSFEVYQPYSLGGINFKLYTNQIIDYCHQIAPASIAYSYPYTTDPFPFNAKLVRWVPIERKSDSQGYYYQLQNYYLNKQYSGWEVKIFRLHKKT